jgi:arsenite methyltransferase
MSDTTDPILDRYAEAARRVEAGDACDGCSAHDGPFGAGNYDDLADLPDAAVRVSLGCGNPIAVADLQPGDTVLDLGSGGGIDVLLSARRVGPTGFAYGLDATV